MSRVQRLILFLTVLAVSGCLALLIYSTHPTLSRNRAAGSASPVQKNLPTQSQMSPAAEAARVRISNAYGKLPMQFEANQGQTDSTVKYISRGSGYRLFLTSNEAVLSLTRHASEKSNTPAVHRSEIPSSSRTEHAAIRMQFVGADPAAEIGGEGELEGRVNYFKGNDPAKWRTNVPAYAKVKYRGVYPGIDLVYYGNQRQLEYDFIVSPGADPKRIRLGYRGAEKLEIDAEGELVMKTSTGEVRQKKPVIYQEANGERQQISGSYAMRGEHEVSIEVGEYDRARPLVIDPVLVYSTFLGGSDSDFGFGVAVDTAGNAYVTGTTISFDFPTVNALQPNPGGGEADAFVAKIGEACVLIISDVSASPSRLWPPDHRLVNVTVSYEVEASCGSANCTLSVSSNEPQNGTGDGDTSPDWEVIDEHHVRLRAERAGLGEGRIYTITITCTDSAGNTTSESVQVVVPHDQD